MQPGTAQEKDNRVIAWNGVRLFIPKAWDARVSGQYHLVFEKDFRPLFQLRWEQAVHHSSRSLEKRLRRSAAELGAVIASESLPQDLQPLGENFDQATLYRQENGRIKGGICYCTDCRTLLLFQILATDPALIKEVRGCLSTLSCRKQTENLWCLQDFTLNLPMTYTLKDYTFAAGLTRLSFLSSDLFLQTCTLGPADIRLQRQSLEQILIALADTPQLQIVTKENDNSCEGFRSPTITQQIFFRLRREKPFVRAAIRHDIGTNRLLAVVLCANHPIESMTLHTIYQQYEIIPK